MSTARYVHWQDQGMGLGYFEACPDYLTQGESLEQLQENLRDLYADLTSGEIPGIRKVAEFDPWMKRAELIRKLEKAGCALIRHRGKPRLVAIERLAPLSLYQGIGKLTSILPGTS